MKPNEALTGRRADRISIRLSLLLGAVLLGAAVSVPSHANELGDGRSQPDAAAYATGATMREIGAGARDAGREIGHGAADAGRTIGDTVRDAAVVTWCHVREAGRTIGRTARDGSKALVRGLKGEPQR